MRPLDFSPNVFLRDLKVVEYLPHFEPVEKFIFSPFIIINPFLGDPKIEPVANFPTKFARALHHFKIAFHRILKVFERSINSLSETLRLIIGDFFEVHLQVILKRLYL